MVVVDPTHTVEVAESAHVFRKLVRIRELEVRVDDRNDVGVLGLECSDDVSPEPDLFGLDDRRELIAKIGVEVAEVVQCSGCKNKDEVAASLNG